MRVRATSDMIDRYDADFIVALTRYLRERGYILTRQEVKGIVSLRRKLKAINEPMEALMDDIDQFGRTHTASGDYINPNKE